MAELPLVSVVTPSYNMGKFIRETVESVLSQDYPRIEHIVMDAGSSDDTLEILRGYGDRIRFYSEPDRGAADAINKGFLRSSGSIFTFLNADDFYLPGAVSAAVRELSRNPEAAVVYGDGYWVDGEGRTIGPYPSQNFDAERLGVECFICQPAAFMRREAFERAGMMDRKLQFTFDYDLWIRIARLSPMVKMDQFLASSRMHRDNKTLGQRRRLLRETIHMLDANYRYVPFHWIGQYVCHLMDGKDQFFERSELSISRYAMALFLGLFYNPRHPGRFMREWSQAMSFGGLVRRCHAFLSSFSR